MEGDWSLLNGDPYVTIEQYAAPLSSVTSVLPRRLSNPGFFLAEMDLLRSASFYIFDADRSWASTD